MALGAVPQLNLFPGIYELNFSAFKRVSVGGMTKKPIFRLRKRLTVLGAVKYASGRSKSSYFAVLRKRFLKTETKSDIKR